MADGLVIEISHVILAGLGDKAVEGLAALARSGQSFALSQASVAGLDLEAMRMLNVRLVGLGAGNIGPAGPSESLAGFAQMARLSRITFYVSDVTHAELVPKLEAVARLACGPCFALPRKVRRTAVDPPVLRMAA